MNMAYIIYFDIEGKQYPFPVNPEELTIGQKQAVEEYEIIKLGKIAVPGDMELTTYSFEAEFPSKPYSYVNTPKGFKPANFYVDMFNQCRKNKTQIRFVASNEYSSISELVIIESMGVVEKAGEEGDYYISFSLIQFVPYFMREVKVGVSTTDNNTALVEGSKPRSGNPPTPPNNSYVVMKGDTLWSIAKKYLGDGGKYMEVYQANKSIIGSNPNLLKVGQKLTIPKKG